MKLKIIRIITLVAAGITIGTSLLYLISGIMIPALGPFSLSLVMYTLIYTAKEQYKVGGVKKGYWNFMKYVGGIGVIANLIAGAAQIMNAIK